MKNIKLFFYFYFIFLIILFIFGVFFDFQISQIFANLENGTYYSLNNYAIIVELFGELPFYFLISICFVVFCCCAKKIKNNVLKLSIQLVLFLCASGILFLAFLRTAKFAKSYVNISLDLITFIALGIISIIVCFLILLFLSKIKQKNLNKFFLFGTMIVLVAIISVIIVQMVKNNLCVRPRFRTINYLNNANLFKPCWNCFSDVVIENVNLPSDACQSFPSGHTMTASIFLCFVFLPNIFKIKTNTKHLCWFLPIFYLFLVAFGRIVAGAHFLTDVVFSALLVGVLYVIFFELIFKKKIIA